MEGCLLKRITAYILLFAFFIALSPMQALAATYFMFDESAQKDSTWIKKTINIKPEINPENPNPNPARATKVQEQTIHTIDAGGQTIQASWGQYAQDTQFTAMETSGIEDLGTVAWVALFTPLLSWGAAFLSWSANFKPSIYKMTQEKGLKFQKLSNITVDGESFDDPNNFYKGTYYLLLAPSGYVSPTPNVKNLVPNGQYKALGIVSADRIQRSAITSECKDDAKNYMAIISPDENAKEVYCLKRATGHPKGEDPQTVPQKYIADTSQYLATTQPTVQTATLTQADVDLCKKHIIQPDSETGWGLLNSIAKYTDQLSGEVAQKAKKQNIDVKTKSVGKSPFQDATRDRYLYYKYYSDMPPDTKPFYPNQIPTTGAKISAEMQVELAKAETWSNEDLKMSKPVEFVVEFFAPGGSSLVTKKDYDIPLPDIPYGAAAAGVSEAVLLAKAGRTAYIAKNAAKITIKGSTKVASEQAGKIFLATGDEVAATAAQLKTAATIAKTAQTTATETVAAAKTAISLSASSAARINLYAIIGTLLIYGTLWGIGQYAKSKDTAFFKSLYELSVTQAYILKQLDFATCINEQVGAGKIDRARAIAAGFDVDSAKAGYELARQVGETLNEEYAKVPLVTSDTGGSGYPPDSQHCAFPPFDLTKMLGSWDWFVEFFTELGCYVVKWMYDGSMWINNTAFNKLIRELTG